MVFVHHAWHAKLLWMGVDLFFILSGFLITNVLLNSKRQNLRSYLGHFYARRSRRLLLPYAITLILASFLFGAAWAKHWYLYIFLTNFLVPLHIPMPAAFDPLWSLAVEEQFYLVWPFVVFFFDEEHLWWISFSLVLAAPCLRGIFHFQRHWPIYMLTPFRMDLLAVGALLCLSSRKYRLQLERWGMKAGIGFTSVGLCGLLMLSKLGITTYGNSRFGNVLIYECALFSCLGLVLWALGGTSVKILCWKPLMYLGQISYTFYLIHLGVLILLSSRFSETATGIITFLICVGYASLSWVAIEEPLLSAGHSQEKNQSASGGCISSFGNQGFKKFRF
jgi:peptidoglycan/LPS O-acetylase OafA/YrhL